MMVRTIGAAGDGLTSSDVNTLINQLTPGVVNGLVSRSLCLVGKTSLNVVNASLGTTPELIVGAFTTRVKTNDFTVNATGGQITYTGATTKTFMRVGKWTVSSSNPRTVVVQDSKDGGSTFVNTSRSDMSISTGFIMTYPGGYPVTLNTNETIGLYLSVTSSTSNVYTTQVEFGLIELAYTGTL